MKRTIYKLLCLILALGMVIGCFAGCDSSSKNDRKDEDEKDPAEETREELDAYELNGLTYYLSEDFANSTDYGDDSNSHFNGDGIEIQVTAGPMGELTDEEINTSKDFAQFFMDFLGDMYDESEIDSKHGIHYMVGISEGVANIMGYYVKDGYGWIIYITNEDGKATDELIDMVTLGQIDENFDSSDYISDDSCDDIYIEENYENEYHEEAQHEEEYSENEYYGEEHYEEGSNKENSEDIANLARKKLFDYELNGLIYYVPGEFSIDTDDSDDNNFHSTGDGIDIDVSCDFIGGLGIKTSEDFAYYFMDCYDYRYEETKIDSKYGISYLIGSYDNATHIIGFYVKGDYSWLICITNWHHYVTESLTDIATLGHIAEDFDITIYMEKAYEEEEYVESPNDYFTVHAYVPDSWGHPGCWAWSNTTGENVFSAWPGEPLNHVSGYYYTIEIPEWAEYIIINGNEGTIQTQDEPVEPGSDVWVVISAIDETYNVYFSEPSAEELANFGY